MILQDIYYITPKLTETHNLLLYEPSSDILSQNRKSLSLNDLYETSMTSVTFP